MDELTVRREAITLEQQAQDYQIQTNEDYSEAADFLKRVKGVEKEVKDYWKPAKEAAAKAHKAICEKEKTMLSICEKAESILKEKMLAYSQKIEAERRAAEEEAKKAAQAEAERLLAEAENAEKAGDTMLATISMAMAEQIEKGTPTVQISKPSLQGISERKVWKVRITDEKAVPSYVNGICVRPVDEKAIMQLHKLNPNIQIPGCEFYQKSQITVR